MVADIACGNCSLRFSVGWFHYHQFDSGYCAQTRLVCTKCGTQHAIEVGNRVRSQQHIEICDVILTSVPDRARLTALKLIRKSLNCTPTEAKQRLDHLPVQLKRRLGPGKIENWLQVSDVEGLTIEYPVVDTEPNRFYGPIKSDRMLGLDKRFRDDEIVEGQELQIILPLVDDDRIDISLQACSGCSSIGTLAHEFDVSDDCPHCGKPELRVESEWIT